MAPRPLRKAEPAAPPPPRAPIPPPANDNRSRWRVYAAMAALAMVTLLAFSLSRLLG